jgi:hypothetical protein
MNIGVTDCAAIGFVTSDDMLPIQVRALTLQPWTSSLFGAGGVAGTHLPCDRRSVWLVTTVSS